MKYLSQENPEIFKDKHVIVRVDFNVPIENGTVSNAEAFRIYAALPTIHLLQNAGAKIVLISHIGRSGDSLQPVADFIIKNIPELKLQFVPEITGDQVNTAIANLKSGECVLLENVRKNPGEESNDPEFAKTLAGYGEYFVEDAFAVAHREHASLVGVPKILPAYLGLLTESEIQHLQQALHPQSPSILIMAGIKFETKLPLIQKLMPLYDHVLLGGGLLNTYLKQSGISIGQSVHDEVADLSAILNNSKVIIPDQVIVERDSKPQTVVIREVQENDTIVDVVIDEAIKEKIKNSKIVVWNGPLGWYEKGYMQSSLDIVAQLHPADQESIVGGGDTITVIRKESLQDKISFLSTGGGAMLEYLQQGTLPAIDAVTH